MDFRDLDSVAAPVVWVVDDDRAVCTALSRLLRTAALNVVVLRSAREVLEALTRAVPDCVLLDLFLEDASGLDLLRRFQLTGMQVPVVFLSAEGDVRTSVRAMKEGAIDARGRAWREARAVREEATSRLATLTPREREVFSLVALGKPNKRIAAELGTTEKTIKVHRGRVMSKLGAESVVDLVRLAQKAHQLAG
jgi:FixJ family two-component response regulator